MKPEDFNETERVDGHTWGYYKDFGWETCKDCMMIRRADKKNSPCRGKAKLRPMEKLIEVSDERSAQVGHCAGNLLDNSAAQF